MINVTPAMRSNQNGQVISIGDLEVVTLKGIGAFSCSQGEITSHFSLHRQLSRAVLVIEGSEFHHWIPAAESFSLAGHLDDSRAISVDKLQPIQRSIS
jgi:hypothetical protein